MKRLIPLLTMIVCSGCATPSIHVAVNCGGTEAKQSVKTDQDQAPTTSTSAAIPVSVGASPSSTGTVNK